MSQSKLAFIIDLQNEIYEEIVNHNRDILFEWLSGNSCTELAEKYFSEHNIRIAVTAINRALIDITPPELRRCHLYDMKRWNYARGVGVGGLTKDENMQAGVKSAVSRGLVPYEGKIKETDYGKFNERDFIVHLKENLKYGWKDIVQLVNVNYHNQRTEVKLKNRYYQKFRTKSPS